MSLIKTLIKSKMFVVNRDWNERPRFNTTNSILNVLIPFLVYKYIVFIFLLLLLRLLHLTLYKNKKKIFPFDLQTIIVTYNNCFPYLNTELHLLVNVIYINVL